MEARVSSAADPNGSAALLALYSTDGPEHVQQVGQGGILVVLVPHQADVGEGNPQQGIKATLPWQRQAISSLRVEIPIPQETKVSRTGMSGLRHHMGAKPASAAVFQIKSWPGMEAVRAMTTNGSSFTSSIRMLPREASGWSKAVMMHWWFCAAGWRGLLPGGHWHIVQDGVHLSPLQRGQQAGVAIATDKQRDMGIGRAKALIECGQLWFEGVPHDAQG